MYEHEFYQPAPDEQLFYKVAESLGGLATERASKILLETGLNSPEDIQFNYGRLGTIQRHFPEFNGQPESEVAETVYGWADLVLAGRERLPSHTDIEDNLIVLYSWLSGKNTKQIADERGVGSVSVSQRNNRLLATLRRNFSLKELFEGRLIDWPVPEEKIFSRAFGRLFAVAYPGEDLAGLNLEQSQKICRALLANGRDIDTKRFGRSLDGMTDTEIATAEGLKSQNSIWTWRHTFMGKKVGQAIGPSEILSALQSDDPDAALSSLFSRISVEDKPPVRQKTQPKKVPEKKKVTPPAGKNPVISKPPKEPRAETSFKSSHDFWSGVSEELKAQRERRNIVDEDISTGVHRTLLELGIDLPTPATRDELEPPRRARMRGGQTHYTGY